MESAPAGAWAQNVSSPVLHSSSVSFLAALPRWGKARPFSLSMDYVVPTALSGVIPIIFGFIFTAILLIALVVRMSPRRKTVDAQLRRVIHNPSRHVWQIPVSWVLVYLATLFVSLGAVAAGVLVNSLHDVIGVLSALVTTVSRTGFAVVDLFLLFVDRLTVLNVANVKNILPAPAGVQPEVIEKAFVTMREYSVSRIPDVRPLRVQLEELVTRLARLLFIVDSYASIVYLVILTLLLIQLLAPAAHFLVDVLYAHKWRARWRFSIYVIYIIFPGFTAWLLLGAASAVGPLIADVCGVMHEYRDHLLNVRTIEPGNIIVESGLVCIPAAAAAEIKTRLDAAVAPLREEIAGNVVEVILNRTSNEVLKSAEWTADEMTHLLECKTLIEISGRLEYMMCGKHANSSAKGVVDMWVAFLGLALVLGFAFLVSTVGVRTAWSTLVWPIEGIAYPRWKPDVDEEKSGVADQEKKDEVDARGNAGLLLNTEPVALTAFSFGETPTTSPADSPRSEGPTDAIFEGTGHRNTGSAFDS